MGRPDDTGLMRIGELSKRVGVRPELLRAWERRYDLLQPARSAGGFRLYAHGDEMRVRRMRGHLERGVAAAQAAHLASMSPVTERGSAGPLPEPLDADTRALAAALEGFDDARAQLLFDRLLGTYSLETFLTGVLLAYLRDLGDRWEQGEISVAQEHFATNMLRGRLLGLARGWDQGNGSRVVLAAPPGEEHDLALIVFGLALRHHGWRITYLGAKSPFETIVQVTEVLKPSIVVLTATLPQALWNYSRELTDLGRKVQVVIAGHGASEEIATLTGVTWTPDDPITAARAIASAS